MVMVVVVVVVELGYSINTGPSENSGQLGVFRLYQNISTFFFNPYQNGGKSRSNLMNYLFADQTNYEEDF
jgi:hypothetical protein